MEYSLEWLLEQETTSPQKYLFFWGHKPAEDGSTTVTCFSQWWQSPFTVDGLVYATAEHWMMYHKALLFGDNEIAEKVLLAGSPAEAKKLGRQVNNFKEDMWNAQRFELVVQGNMNKFSQDEKLKAFLLNTGNQIIVEASPVDNIWGIGLAASDKSSRFPAQWKGLNLLGFALMEVRKRLSN